MLSAFLAGFSWAQFEVVHAFLAPFVAVILLNSGLPTIHASVNSLRETFFHHVVRLQLATTIIEICPSCIYARMTHAVRQNFATANLI